jgi:hypothetical protein
MVMRDAIGVHRVAGLSLAVANAGRGQRVRQREPYVVTLDIQTTAR